MFPVLFLSLKKKFLIIDIKSQCPSPFSHGQKVLFFLCEETSSLNAGLKQLLFFPNGSFNKGKDKKLFFLQIKQTKNLACSGFFLILFFVCFHICIFESSFI